VCVCFARLLGGCRANISLPVEVGPIDRRRQQVDRVDLGQETHSLECERSDAAVRSTNSLYRLVTRAHGDCSISDRKVTASVVMAAPRYAPAS